MWIILVIFASFFNALWTAMSKRQLGELSPFQFTLMFRAITAILLLPPFLYSFKLSSCPIFWLTILGAAALEVIGIYSQSHGVKKDFYSTYSLSNTSPLFTLAFAPMFLTEKINLTLFLGSTLMVIGGVIFYQINPKISLSGIIRAITAALGGIFAKIAIGYSSGLSYPFITFAIGIWLMVLVSPFRKESINWNLFKPFTRKLLPLAIFSAIATLLYYMSVEMAPITKVNPLIRINLFFGFLLSYYMLNERKHIKRKAFASVMILIGAILIAIA